MRRLIVLLGVAVALLFGLLVLMYSHQPREYEVNYTIAVSFYSAEGSQSWDLGWMVVGVGRENYTMGVFKYPGAELLVFEATEGGRNYTAVCAMGRCFRDTPQRDLDVLNFKVTDIKATGKCRYMGYEGEVYRVEGVFDLLAEVARARGVEFNVTGAGEVCIAGDLLLWARERYVFNVGGRQAVFVVVINASKIGPYNEERYREILQKAKAS
ncbi:MAG: hypothetical protein QXK71_06490 [Pyrobaculum sp.]